MRYIKLFMLFAVASLFASCSDDETINSNNVTAGFVNDTIVVKENTGFFNIPIKIEGARNGDVKLEVSVAGTGTNPATEDKNYRITGKSLQLLTDTLKSSTLNVEVQTVDDQEINENREFTVTIKSQQGVTLTDQVSVVVVIRDNDAAFYEKFFGKWEFTAIDSDGNDVKRNITISGVTDESDPWYDYVLSVHAPAFLNVGVDLDFDWYFLYEFDKETKTGSLTFVQGETISSYGGVYEWCWLSNAQYYTTEWALGEGDSFPTEISFSTEDNGPLYFYATAPSEGWWERYSDIKIRKIQ